ncbi:Trafficking protein particle complex subunit 33, variant 2 [Puccinia graminis f. sp. tritici]|nr:Trafficking protein particle complex subunit 33, variant 2 [Puccinia graminis f. sp. tritici]
MIHSISESAAHSLKTSSDAKRAYQEKKRLQLGGTGIKGDQEPSRITSQTQKTELDEAHRIRMDAAGYKVGWSLAERLLVDLLYHFLQIAC